MTETRKMAKALAKHPDVVSERLTPSEIEIICLNFPPTGNLLLSKPKEIRREMRRVYEAAIRGRIPLTAATKLFYMLEKVSRSRSEEDKLAILERGGIGGAPFIGLILEGPRQ